MIVISAYASVNYVDQTTSEHGSVLKCIEQLFGLPTLASVNSTFNTSTPNNAYNQTGGAPFPPRGGQPLSIVIDMTNCFDFSATPILYPDVPGVPWYSEIG